MASLDSVKARQVLTTGKVVQRKDDTPVAIRLRYKGTGTVTSVTMTTATNLVLITSDGGTDTYTFASGSGTMGALAANINADGVFEAKLLDCLAADVTTASNFKANAAITSSYDELGNVVYDLLVDTDVPDYMTVCLSPFANFDAPKGHRVHVQELKYKVNVASGVANGVRVYTRDSAPNGAKHGTEVQILNITSVDNTETTITFASGEAKLSGKEDQDIIFRINSGAITDGAGNYVQIVGEIE